MKTRKPKPENVAKLTPEQQEIFRKWEEEHAATAVLIEKSLEALGRGDRQASDQYLNQIDKLVPSFCEHGVSIWSDCPDCDEIWKIVYPEEYGYLEGRAAPTDKKLLN